MLSEKFTVDLEDFTTFTDKQLTQSTTKPKDSTPWNKDADQVKQFLEDCRKINPAPDDKQQIYDALEIASFSAYTGTRNDALATVTAHMAELARIANEVSLQDIPEIDEPTPFKVGHEIKAQGGTGPKLKVTKLNADGTYTCEITLVNDGGTSEVTKTHQELEAWGNTGKTHPYGKQNKQNDLGLDTQYNENAHIKDAS